MHIYQCITRLHDVVFYATREMGRLYETEKYLHNFALTYALQLVRSDYYTPEQVPCYHEHFQALNQQGMYITPAKPLHVDFVIHTFKLASTWYHVEMEKPKKNIPGYGRAKELAPESDFEFFVFSQSALNLPKWIRLGKWMGKAALQTTEISNIQEKRGRYAVSHPLNPLDLPVQPTRYDMISMPPVSLIRNIGLEGEYYEIEREDQSRICLPKGMSYFGMPLAGT